MSILEPIADHTYLIYQDGELIEHYNVSRVRGRRIELCVTAWSALCWQTTRLRWQKAMSGLLTVEGITIVEQPSSLQVRP